MSVTVTDKNKIINTVNDNGERIVLAEYLFRHYNDGETNTDFSTTYRVQGQDYKKIGFAYTANSGFVDPWDAHELFLNQGCEFLKVVNGTTSVILEYRPANAFDMENPIIWNTYQSARSRSVDNLVHPMIRVTVPLKAGADIHVMEGFHYKWCTNGGFSFTDIKEYSIPSGNLVKELPKQLDNLMLPRQLEILELHSIHQLMKGESVTNWTYDKYTKVKNIFNQLEKQGKKNSPELDMETFPYHIRDSVTFFRPKGVGRFGLKWLHRNIIRNLELLPDEALSLTDIEQVITNAINMEHDVNRFSVTDVTRSQRSLTANLARIISGV